MDSILQHADGPRVHLREPFQARDTLQVSHAGSPEPVVCAARYSIYVLLRTPRGSNCNGTLYSAEKRESYRKREQPHRQSGVYRYSIPHLWDAFRGIMGKRGMGALLGMGPKRDLGSNNLAVLHHLPPLQEGQPPRHTDFMYPPYLGIPVPADMLVGDQLPPFSQRKQHPHLQCKMIWNLNPPQDLCFPEESQLWGGLYIKDRPH